MTLKDEGLPIHEDATATIRPRLFLEGNFFIDLKPGTPSAPELDGDGEIPVTQTSTSVQIDEVLSALQSDTREELKGLLSGYGTALSYQPTADGRHGPGADLEGQDGRSGARRLAPLRRRGGPRDDDRQPGAARRGRARPVRPDPRAARRLQGARHGRVGAPGPDHRLQHDGRRACAGAGQRAGDHPRARPDVRGGAALARQPERGPAAASALRPAPSSPAWRRCPT